MQVLAGSVPNLARGLSEELQFSPKRERHSTDQKKERGGMIPFDAFAEIRPREDDEHAKRDDLLDHFQLKRCEFTIADAIRGDLKTIFSERDEPAHQDYCQKRSFAVFQVTVPGNRHEDIRANQKENCFHGARSYHGRNTEVSEHNAYLVGKGA
jgi:hypothetical protein